MFSLESPHLGDSNEYTQYTIFNIKQKITLNYPKSAAMGFFQGTQERVRNSRGKRAISVRAIEGQLYMNTKLELTFYFVLIHAIYGVISTAKTIDFKARSCSRQNIISLILSIKSSGQSTQIINPHS